MQYTQSVERLYCERAIQFLASSKILTPPPPHPLASVYPHAFGAGVNLLEDARHSSVLYICKYFVT
jgi:hypothetical protein